MADFVPPQTDTEKTIAGLWEDILGIQEVGLLDEFSALGGDSLIALRLISQLIEVFDIDITVRAIYDYPTVETLASRVDNLRWLGTAEPANFDDDDDLEEGVI